MLRFLCTGGSSYKRGAMHPCPGVVHATVVVSETSHVGSELSPDPGFAPPLVMASGLPGWLGAVICFSPLWLPGLWLSTC